MNRGETKRIRTKRRLPRVLLACTGVTALAHLGCPPLDLSAFDSPEEIVGNDAVQDVVAVLRDIGIQLSLSMELDPPRIEGVYRSTGENIVPGFVQHGDSILTFRNQTGTNDIEVTEESIGLETDIENSTTRASFIRGSGNTFTVYAATTTRANAGPLGPTCELLAVSILDGVVNPDTGAIDMISISVTAENFTPDVCATVPTANRSELVPLE